MTLEKHMESFDDLGINCESAYYWHKSILNAIETAGIDTIFIYGKFTNNYLLMKEIVFDKNTFNLLSSKGLINNGICPFTGEIIDNTFYFNLFSRYFYLSETAFELCQDFDKNKRNNYNPTVDNEHTQESKEELINKVILVTPKAMLCSFVLSIIASWQIVAPTSLFPFLGFGLLAVVLFCIFYLPIYKILSIFK